jgi:hypothetical protein
VTLSTDQILALAPDASSAKAGSALATASKWSNLGNSDIAIWGECQGSGSTPYRAQIDLREPAFKCSCPSRKFPCKHGLGLFLLYSGKAELFAATAAPQWNLDWLQSREARATKKQETAEEKLQNLTPEKIAQQAEQAQKREEKREAKVARGLQELQTWLEDLAREGFSSLRNAGTAQWDAIAARMVDAQMAPLAGRLSRAGRLAFQTNISDWEEQLAREIAAIYLLIRAYQKIESLTPDLQEDVRSMLGWNQSQDSLLAQAGQVDCWQVVAQKTRDDERVRTRITYLCGKSSGLWAMFLQYAVGTQGFDRPIAVGSEFEGELVFYPGAAPLRALIKDQRNVSVIKEYQFPATQFEVGMQNYARVIAANPFIERLPLSLSGLRLQLDGERWLAILPDRQALYLPENFAYGWQLLAVSGGQPMTLVGEWDGYCFTPLSVQTDRQFLSLESDCLL